MPGEITHHYYGLPLYCKFVYDQWSRKRATDGDSMVLARRNGTFYASKGLVNNLDRQNWHVISQCDEDCKEQNEIYWARDEAEPES